MTDTFAPVYYDVTDASTYYNDGSGPIAIVPSGSMSAATYDPDTITEQVVGLTASQTVSNKDLSASSALCTGAAIAMTLADHFATSRSAKGWLTGTGDEHIALGSLLAAANGAPINGDGLTVTLNSSAASTYSYPAYIFNMNFVLPYSGNGLVLAGSLGSSASPTNTFTAGVTSAITYSSNPGYVADDLIFIISSDAWGGSSEVKSQWAEVASVSGAGPYTVNLKSPVDYDFSSSILTYNPTLLNGVTFVNCTFTGLGANNSQKLLVPQYCRNVNYIGCTFQKSGHSGSEPFRCYDLNYRDCTFKDMYGTGLAYGLSHDGGCERITGVNLRGSNLRHIVTGGGTSGINRYAEFTNTIVTGATSALVDTHTSCDRWRFNGVSGDMAVGAGSESITMQGARCEVYDIAIANPTGPIMYQPLSNASGDYGYFTGHLDGFPSTNSQPTFLYNNKKSGGDVSMVKFHGFGKNNGTGGQGVISKIESNADTNASDFNIVSRSNSHSLLLQTTSGSGALKNTNIRGLYQQLDNSTESIYINVGAGAIDGVNIDADVSGGTYGVRNVSNAATNVRVNTARISGFVTAATLGTVSTTWGSGSMLSSTYDAANIAQQVVGTTATQTLTNKTLTNPTINGTAITGNAWNVIGNSGTASSVTGTTAETILATVTIPANSLGANGTIRVHSLWSQTNNANSKTKRVRLGGIGGTAYMGSSDTTIATFRDSRQIYNANATNSQVGASNSASTTGMWGVTSGALTTSAINTTSSVDLVFTGTLANSADTVTLLAYTVEILHNS